MSRNLSSPQEINRLPKNSKDGKAELSPSASPNIRIQANAKLTENISPQESPYGSYRTQTYLKDFSSSPGARNSGISINPCPSEAGEDLESARNSFVDTVKKHLVTKEDILSSSFRAPTPNFESHSIAQEPQEVNDNLSDYSHSHNLLGGDITRDVYKWQETEERRNTDRPRSKSFVLPPDQTSQLRSSELLMPGAFRRHHITSLAEREGRQKNLVTGNFIDFLALYGHFAGGVYPEDGEDSDLVDEETPLIGDESERNPNAPQPTASAGKAVFLLIKSFVGTGVLFLPRSFYDGGMGFSILILATISFFGLYCMLLLVESQAAVGGGFGDMAMRLYGSKARFLVLFSLAVSQFGFSCAYMIFIAKNLQDVFYGVTECKYVISEYWFILVQLLFYIPVALLRKIKSFSLMALVADVFIILGLFYLVWFNVNHISNNGLGAIEQFNKDNFTLFIGTAIFTFEGIGLVVPIVESMKEPEKFPAILSWTMLAITSVFIFIGSLSYATFGDQVQTVVLSNLPRGAVASETVQTMYAMAIILSVPLQIFPIIGILESGLFTRSGRNSYTVKWQKNMFRLLIVLSIALMAWLGSDSLGHFVAIVGSFCCIPLSFIYPAAFHLKAFPQASHSQKVKNWAIIVIGLVLMVYVTLQTLANWNSGGEEKSTPCLPPN